MTKISLIHGANLNLLGKRSAQHYGRLTLKHLEQIVCDEAQKFNYEVIAFQSNHEGEIVDRLQTDANQCVGIIINPGAFAHYSYAIYDALLDTKLPIIEVHLSAIAEREEWRRKSVTASACLNIISGKKEKGYIEAVKLLVGAIRNDKK